VRLDARVYMLYTQMQYANVYTDIQLHFFNSFFSSWFQLVLDFILTEF